MRLLHITLCILSLMLLSLNVRAQETGAIGYAVFYADYLEGRKTANGEIFSNSLLTCAHRTLPFGTLLKVIRPENQRSVLVRVNDRGPFNEELLIDLSKAAAMELGFLNEGRALVQIQVLGQASANPTLPANPSYGELTVKGGAPIEAPRLQAGNSGFFIQFASYTDLNNAERQLEALHKKGLNELKLDGQTTPQGQHVYKILIGSFQERSEAEKYLQQVKAQHYLDGYVFHKP
jgi:rare lipoprotein A